MFYIFAKKGPISYIFFHRKSVAALYKQSEASSMIGYEWESVFNTEKCKQNDLIHLTTLAR